MPHVDDPELVLLDVELTPELEVCVEVVGAELDVAVVDVAEPRAPPPCASRAVPEAVLEVGVL